MHVAVACTRGRAALVPGTCQQGSPTGSAVVVTGDSDPSFTPTGPSDTDIT